eukprot:CAMPEP_0182437756 /NCGR_PEP_ID=MMETSP1167-20130531/85259_1 /TAXON_ID=2988 /ORGANISM="Mallomonas Sp, Strain CCMP3275" /LENGTH=448 /DNA_ID=CAMNT_0024630787 /DNA_START=507 /DNA_END=1853 /DNA_ORIENTATION=+
MTQMRIRNLPVFNKGQVVGMITLKDLADSSFKIAEIGGKKGYINKITGRRGLPEDTILNPSSQLHSEETEIVDATPKLRVTVGKTEIPHPFKTEGGTASSHRDYGAEDLNNDVELCEDAHFAVEVRGRCGVAPQIYVCVADGVGSWRQYGVDPRLYSHTLVEQLLVAVRADERKRIRKLDDASSLSLSPAAFEPIHPLNALMKAWHAMGGESWTGEVTGSCTVCIATIDPHTCQLSYSNLGDCGLLVIRHIDSEVAGYMRDRRKPRHLRTSDLRLAYVSQQQLKGFNLPYQLGHSDIEEHSGTFETPADADTASIPVVAGDIVLLATDGLFDNVDLDEIVVEVGAWEQKWFPAGRDESADPAHEANAVQDLSLTLCQKAREFSLDHFRDSPFAVLAKENDIMWSGGMPDDTTVVVMKVMSTFEEKNFSLSLSLSLFHFFSISISNLND